MRPSGNGSLNFVIVRFRFALNEGYRFYIFFLKFSVLLFSNRRVMGSHISHSSIGLDGWKCAAVEIYVIPCYERFVKIWNFASFFYSKIFVMCVYESIHALKLALGCRIALEAKWLRKHEFCYCAFYVCIERRIQILYFFFLKFSVLLFSHHRVKGCYTLHSSIGLEG